MWRQSRRSASSPPFRGNVLRPSHAEVIAASSAAFDVTWSRGLTGDLGLPQTSATPLCVDAKNVITIVQNWLSSNKMRHIKRRDLVVREKEVEGLYSPTRCGRTGTVKRDERVRIGTEIGMVNCVGPVLNFVTTSATLDIQKMRRTIATLSVSLTFTASWEPLA